MWEILWMSAPVLLIMIVFLPETSVDNILLRRAQRLRRVTKNPNIRSPREVSHDTLSFWGLMRFSLVKPIEIMAKDPAILFTNIYTSLVYGIYYSFFEAFPLVFPVIYGFSPGQAGLVFVSLAVACGMGVVAYITYIYTYLIPDFKKHGHRNPEHRLVPAVVASLFPPVGLALFGKNPAVLDNDFLISGKRYANWYSIQHGPPEHRFIGWWASSGFCYMRARCSSFSSACLSTFHSYTPVTPLLFSPGMIFHVRLLLLLSLCSPGLCSSTWGLGRALQSSPV